MRPSRVKLSLALGLVAVGAVGMGVATGGGKDPQSAIVQPRCPATRVDYACLDRRYGRIVRTSGVRAAFLELKREHRRSQVVRTACHQVAHSIGRAAASGSRDPARPFSEGDSFCEAGYYHGVVEELAANLGPRAFLRQLNGACRRLRRQATKRLYAECVHGLGHGVMSVLGNDLYAALKACDRLRSSRNRNRCYSGVFMENAASAAGLTHLRTRYVKRREPLYPCNAVARRYRRECYPMQAIYAVRRANDDYPAVFALCARVRQPHSGRCYQGLGAAAVQASTTESLTLAGQTTEADQICRLGPDREAMGNCVLGAVRAFVFVGSTARGRRFCGIVERSVRGDCLRERRRFGRALGIG
jgi:hypothetical protein